MAVLVVVLVRLVVLAVLVAVLVAVLEQAQVERLRHPQHKVMLVRQEAEEVEEAEEVLVAQEVVVLVVLVLQIHCLGLLLPILLVVKAQLMRQTKQGLLIAEMAVVLQVFPKPLALLIHTTVALAL